MANSYPTVAFEIPLYRQPSEHLRNLLRQVETAEKHCYAMVQNGKLTFTMSSTEKASITPCIKKHPDKDAIVKQLSLFASKFNATSSIVAKQEATMKIEIREIDEETRKSEYPEYGKDVLHVLKVNVTSGNREALRVLAKFLALLDSYGN